MAEGSIPMPLYPKGALILAPLSGYTDLPYRRAAARCGCKYAFTEMIDAAALVYARKRTEVMLTRGEDEKWLGVQLVSGNADHLKKAVEILNGCRRFDVLDFNLGCPVPKVTGKGAGAALGRNVERALELFGVIAEASKVPVTAKIRVVSDVDPEPTLRLVSGLAALGAAAVTIHGRAMERFYSGPVATEIIALAAENVRIPVIANGGVTGLESFRDLTRSCGGIGGVMLARGAMGNPWLFGELEDDGYQPPSVAEFVELVRVHILEMLDFYGEETGSRGARKILLDYLRGRGFYGEWRGRAGTLSSRREYMEFLDSAPEFHSPDYWKNPPAERTLAPA